jgi:hypothetical protein
MPLNSEPTYTYTAPSRTPAGTDRLQAQSGPNVVQPASMCGTRPDPSHSGHTSAGPPVQWTSPVPSQ